MLVENGIVRVGAEIEVAAWKTGHGYRSVAKKLLDAGFMEGTEDDWQRYHDYNCRCEKGCARVRSGAVLLPNPLVSIQYDASLPDTGAEFIVSPVLLINGMEEMREIWQIVTDAAMWRGDMVSMRGQPNAAPSIHLHVSVLHPEDRPQDLGGLAAADRRGAQNVADLLHALSLFAPELLLLSDIEEFRRGLAFRQPWRHADGRNGHHGFIDVRAFRPGREVYIEWRMFEAAYNDWNYLEAAAYVSAGLTRAMMNADTIPRLMGAGYQMPPPSIEIENAIRNNDTAAVLQLASPRRLGALRDIIEAEMYDDAYGANVIRRKFEEVERHV
jgi:hypothetical protein